MRIADQITADCPGWEVSYDDPLGFTARNGVAKVGPSSRAGILALISAGAL
jgi:hypothetical protein